MIRAVCSGDGALSGVASPADRHLRGVLQRPLNENEQVVQPLREFAEPSSI